MAKKKINRFGAVYQIAQTTRRKEGIKHSLQWYIERVGKRVYYLSKLGEENTFIRRYITIESVAHAKGMFDFTCNTDRRYYE